MSADNSVVKASHITLRPWRLLAVPGAADEALAREMGQPTWLAALMRLRGMTDPIELKAFFTGDISTMPDPFLLSDMDRAVNRLLQAHQKGEQIAIYGDYDADGVTATALLVRGLCRLGFETPLTYIPDRFDEGYGMNVEALEYLLGEGAELILTVDCGITALAEAEYLYDEEIDLIITDHHQLGNELPRAVAVVNPQRREGEYPSLSLAGVGVAYELLRALCLRMQHPEVLQELTSLVAIGTLADQVELTGVNRLLVRDGLRVLAHTQHPGLRALLKLAKLNGELGAQQVQFGLVPKINASGRMQHADLALELLLSENPEEATTLAAELDSLNNLRKRIEQEIFQEAQAQYEAFDATVKEQCVQLFYASHWHPGVIGIVAAKLMEKLGRPVLVACADEEGVKGSGRAPEGYNLFQMMSDSADLLARFGGHYLAVGFSCAEEKLMELQHRLCSVAKRKSSIAEEYRGDLELPTDGDWQGIYRTLRKLEPFGSGNEDPVWLLRGAEVKQVRLMGQGEHLSARLSYGGAEIDMVAWRQAASMANFNGMVDLLARLVKNVFKGQETIRLDLVAWRSTELDHLETIRQLRQLPPAAKIRYSMAESFRAVLESGCVAADQAIPASQYSQEYPYLPLTRCVSLGSGLGQIVDLDPLFEISTESHLRLTTDLQQRAYRHLLHWLLPDLAALRRYYRWLRDQGDQAFDEIDFSTHPGGLKGEAARASLRNVAVVFVEAGLLEVGGDKEKRLRIVTQGGQVAMESVAGFQKLLDVRKKLVEV